MLVDFPNNFKQEQHLRGGRAWLCDARDVKTYTKRRLFSIHYSLEATIFLKNYLLQHKIFTENLDFIIGCFLSLQYTHLHRLKYPKL